MAATVASKEIVILGGSYGGLSTTHYLLKHVIPKVPEPASYHITMVSASSAFFGRPAAPRALISEKLLPSEKVFASLEDALKQYGDKVKFIHGSATGMDPTARTVTVTNPAGEISTLSYYALVIATGTNAPSPLLSLQTEHTLVNDSWLKFRDALPAAKSIVISGGGPAGIETAGELGEYLNGKPGMFAGPNKTPKVPITVITSDKKILPILRPGLAEKAERLLLKVGVTVIKNTRVESVSPLGTGEATAGLDPLIAPATVSLSNGDSLSTDLYIPATGVKPNTSFLPKELLTPKGYVDTDPVSMRVPKAGERVYCIGDVGSYTRGGILDLYAAVPVLATNIQRDLLFAAPGVARTGKDRPYEGIRDETQLVPVGSSGVGSVHGWSLPSFFVWMIKGRDYFISYMPDLVSGKQWNKESKWKFVS